MAHLGNLAYKGVQLEAQGWDYYLVGDGDASWRGPATKLLAYQAFLELVHPEQVRHFREHSLHFRETFCPL